LQYARISIFKHILTAQKEQIILGIDPGTAILGYGVVLQLGNKFQMLECNALNIKKTLDHNEKLKRIYDHIDALIKKYLPDALSVEAPFFGKNVQSMLKLGRVQGVAIISALNHNIPITEYSPKEIKQSITGNGNASKEQVAYMLMQMLKIKEKPEHLDATDGLAAALCHALNLSKFKTQATQYSGWESFLKDNPTRLGK
jgi:crossover junction endodeoxyribonuclease RuvC